MAAAAAGETAAAEAAAATAAAVIVPDAATEAGGIVAAAVPMTAAEMEEAGEPCPAAVIGEIPIGEAAAAARKSITINMKTAAALLTAGRAAGCPE